MRRLALVSLASLVLGGPVHGQDELRWAERRGSEIFLQDRAASLATDEATVEFLVRSGIQGYVVTNRELVYDVHFIGRCEGSNCVHFRVAVDFEAQSSELVVPEDAAPVSGIIGQLWKARNTALSKPFTMCTPSYNLVVLPEDNAAAANWVVYLLAATTNANQAVMTGHHRVTVSNDGAEILREEELFNACLVQEVQGDTAGLMITEVVSDYPTELHVFMSMNYNLPIYVSAGERVYSVARNTIALVE